MASHTLTVNREIIAEPAAVWKVITDLDRAPKVFTGIVAVERVEGDGFDVGTRWRETRRIAGKEGTEEMWVSAVDEGKSYTVSAKDDGVEYTTLFEVKPSSVGTTVAVTFGAEATGAGLGQRMLMSIFGGIGAKITRNALKQDLDDLAAAIERR